MTWEFKKILPASKWINKQMRQMNLESSLGT